MAQACFDFPADARPTGPGRLGGDGHLRPFVTVRTAPHAAARPKKLTAARGDSIVGGPEGECAGAAVVGRRARRGRRGPGDGRSARRRPILLDGRSYSTADLTGPRRRTPGPLPFGGRPGAAVERPPSLAPPSLAFPRRPPRRIGRNRCPSRSPQPLPLQPMPMPEPTPDATAERVLASARRTLAIEADALNRLADSLDGAFRQAVDVVMGVRGRGGGHRHGQVGPHRAEDRRHPGVDRHAGLLRPPERGEPRRLGHGRAGGRADRPFEQRRHAGTGGYSWPMPGGSRLPVVAITSRAASSLGEHADVLLLLPDAPEACPMGLAPTTSTTLMLALGDAPGDRASGAAGVLPATTTSSSIPAARWASG